MTRGKFRKISSNAYISEGVSVLPVASLGHLLDTLLDVLDLLPDLMASCSLCDNIHHLLHEPLGAPFARGLRALDADQEDVDDVFHVVGQLPYVTHPDHDLLFVLLSWHLHGKDRVGCKVVPWSG